MNIWPALAKKKNEDIKIGFGDKFFYMDVEFWGTTLVQSRVVGVELWYRSNETHDYKMQWSWSVERTWLNHGELRI